MKRPTVCLVMIVKDEAHIIERCLASVLPYIDNFFILDTGSTDDTKAIIRRMLAHLGPGVCDAPWVDFSHNRNLALHWARHLQCDYLLMMDADDVFHGPGSGRPLEIGTQDLYDVEMRDAGTVYYRPLLMRSSLAAEYVGSVHECLVAQTPARAFLRGAYVQSTRDGARSKDPEKYRRDAALLEAELERTPGDPRVTFYLAQSYRDAGDVALAVDFYRKRAEITAGWADERYQSIYEVGKLQEAADRPNQAVASYLKAWQFDPTRAEPLYRAAMIHQGRKEWAVSHMMLNRAAKIQKPPASRLFVEPDIYDTHIPLELAVACYWIGDDTRAMGINRALLRGGRLILTLHERVRANLEFSINRQRAKRGKRNAA